MFVFFLVRGKCAYLRPLQTLPQPCFSHAHEATWVHVLRRSLGHQDVSLLMDWLSLLMCLMSKTAFGPHKHSSRATSLCSPACNTAAYQLTGLILGIVRERVHFWQQENLSSKEPLLWFPKSLQERRLAYFQRWRGKVILKGQAGFRRSVCSSVLSSMDCVGLGYICTAPWQRVHMIHMGL